LVEPVDTGRCTVHFDYFYEDGASDARIRDDLEYSERVQQEGIEICERVQEGLQSIGYDRGRFSVECEQGVWHFQAMLKRAFATESLDLRRTSFPDSARGTRHRAP
jgi:choline monooxygenase